MDTQNISQCPEVSVKCFLLSMFHSISNRQDACSTKADCGIGILPVLENGAVFPLNRAKNSARVLYVSPIALKLAKTWQQTPQAIAAQLAETLEPLCCPNFAVKVAPTGIIEFELTDACLGFWLQRLAQTKLAIPESRILSAVVNADRLFPIQYSHARCCSLLRMAHRDRLISIAQPDVATAPQIWSLTAPNPIPWLDKGDRLRLIHPAECNLISQLITVLDNLAPILGNCTQNNIVGTRHCRLLHHSGATGIDINTQNNIVGTRHCRLLHHSGATGIDINTQNNIVGTRHCRLLYHSGATGIDINYLKLANNLSAAFQTFYSQCRIWGEVKIQTPKLAQARLGLVLATQSLLRFILEELLSAVAPLEL